MEKSILLNVPNRQVLEHIGKDELGHYKYLKSLTDCDTPPHRLRIWFFAVMGILLGLSFTLKLQEKQEEGGQKSYGELLTVQDGLSALPEAEGEH